MPDVSECFHFIPELAQDNTQHFASVYDGIYYSNELRYAFSNRLIATRYALDYLKSVDFQLDDKYFQRTQREFADILVFPLVDLDTRIARADGSHNNGSDESKAEYEKLLQYVLTLYPASILKLSEKVKKHAVTFYLTDILQKYLPHCFA